MIVLFQDRISQIEKHATPEVQLDPMPTTLKQNQQVCPSPERLEPITNATTSVKVEMTVTSTDSDNQQVCPSPDITADETTRKKLLQQIESLTRANLKQAKQIRHLQKKTWYQTKRIVNLTATINELKKQNLVKGNPVSSLLDH